MAYDINVPSSNTGSGLQSQAPDALRRLWQKGIDVFEQNTDFWLDFEGATKRSVIQSKTDTAAGKGQKITFTNMSGFYQEPKQGDELFETSADFEDLTINDYTMTVDWLRNAVRTNERTEEHMGMRGELTSGFNTEMGKWMGRTKSERMFMTFLHKGSDESYSVINGKTVDTLGGSDTLNYDAIVTMKTQLKRLGGAPAIGAYNRDNGRAEYRNFVIAVTDELDSLEKDTDYKRMLVDGDVRGNMNYIFKSGFKDVRGQIIKEYNPIDHDGPGAIGSPLNPKAQLGVAITAGTGAFDITGGGSAARAAKTKYKYFKHFPNYAYQFIVGDVLATTTDPFYLLIVNPPDGSATANLMGFYKCVVNDGNKITVTERLAPSAAGSSVNKTTIGGVTWNVGVWEGKTTTTHPSGAMIYLSNAKGQPIGDVLYTGACAAYRGYGKYRNSRTEQTYEGGFVRDVFVTTVFGQELRKDVDLRTPGFMSLKVAINYAGTPIPTNIS